MGSQLAFYIQSIGFSFILIGINYLIFQERLLGQKAVTVEKYVNEAVHYNREFLNFFWAFLAGVFSINIESYELSCKRVVQFVNGYSKPH